MSTKNSHAVSGGEVAVDKLEVGQVSHSSRNLNREADELFDGRLLQRQHTRPLSAHQLNATVLTAQPSTNHATATSPDFNNNNKWSK